MKSLKQTFFLLMLCFVMENTFAQQPFESKGFPAYAELVSKGYDITCKMPDKFIDLKYLEPFSVRKNGKPGYFYYPVLQSANNECILMYPCLPAYYGDTKMEIEHSRDTAATELFSKEAVNARLRMINEIKTALGLTNEYGFALEDTMINTDKYVTLLSGKEAKKRFNADTVFIFQLPLENPYKEKYVYCTGMTLYKKDSPVMYFKWLFTEAGKKNEKKYLNMLNKKVWYGNKKRFFNKKVEEDYLYKPVEEQ